MMIQLEFPCSSRTNALRRCNTLAGEGWKIKSHDVTRSSDGTICAVTYILQLGEDIARVTWAR